jgi:hypothetical protein
MDAVVRNALVAIDRRAWDEMKRLLHPYLHWTAKDGRTIRGRKNVIAYLADAPPSAPPSAPPARHELRDGQIYRWVEDGWCG